MASEKRLIDANALLEKLKKTDRYFNIKFDVENAPTVDAVELVHGRWLKVKDGYGIDRGWKCSSCNNYIYAMTYEPYEYCPHCGAMMDGERKKDG